MHKSEVIRISCCFVPKTLYPSQKAFEALGFGFENSPDNDFYLVTLPSGWKSISNSAQTLFIDTKERVRASYTRKNSHMDLCQRFYILPDHINPDRYPSPVTVSVADSANYQKRIFIAGQCQNETCMEFDELVDKAHTYLDTHYPNWQDPTKYWD